MSYAGPTVLGLDALIFYFCQTIKITNTFIQSAMNILMHFLRSISFHRIVTASFLTFISVGAFAINYKAYRTEIAPVVDGIGKEDCWSKAQWALINQPFDGKALPDSADFYGRYKVVWNSSRLYILMEITDDKLVDNRANPSDNYWEDDCTEFFIDEDHTAQGHECGVDAFKAFAYHIAAVPRDKNNYANGSILSFDSPDGINHVIDLGSDCNTAKGLNLDDHVKVKMTKNGNKYTWELEFKIFDKSYNQNSGTNTPVTLTANKVMGFAIAYCDDDNGKRENMIGTVPNHNDYSGKYPFYRFTNEFGTLTLNDSVLSPTLVLNRSTALSKLNVWPNPVENLINFNIISNNSITQQIRIINILGKTVLAKKNALNIKQIDVASLKSGVYILEVSDSNTKYLQKFIKR